MGDYLKNMPFCVRQKGERKPNFVFASSVSSGCACVRLCRIFRDCCKDTKMAPPLDFCRGKCRPGNWCELMTTSDNVYALVLGYFYIHCNAHLIISVCIYAQ